MADCLMSSHVFSTWRASVWVCAIDIRMVYFPFKRVCVRYAFPDAFTVFSKRWLMISSSDSPGLIFGWYLKHTTDKVLGAISSKSGERLTWFSNHWAREMCFLTSSCKEFKPKERITNQSLSARNLLPRGTPQSR